VSARTDAALRLNQLLAQGMKAAGISDSIDSVALRKSLPTILALVNQIADASSQSLDMRDNADLDEDALAGAIGELLMRPMVRQAMAKISDGDMAEFNKAFSGGVGSLLDADDIHDLSECAASGLVAAVIAFRARLRDLAWQRKIIEVVVVCDDGGPPDQEHLDLVAKHLVTRIRSTLGKRRVIGIGTLEEWQELITELHHHPRSASAHQAFRVVEFDRDVPVELDERD